MDAHDILRSHLIPLVLSGLNSDQELCRIEFVSCLADLISRFPNHPHFTVLHPLNKYWSYFDETGNEDEHEEIEMLDDTKVEEKETSSDEEIIVDNAEDSDGKVEERGRERKAATLEQEDSKALPDSEAVELNFFANAVHIQVHRRQRAFYRLTEQLSNGEVCELYC